MLLPLQVWLLNTRAIHAHPCMSHRCPNPNKQEGIEMKRLVLAVVTTLALAGMAVSLGACAAPQEMIRK